MQESFPKEDLRQRVRWYVGLRWFLIIALGITGTIPQILQQGFVPQVKQNVLVILAVLIINGLFLGISQSRKLRYGIYQTLAISQLVLDLGIISGVVYFNGGIENIIFALYVMPIVMSGALLGRSAIYITGVSAAILYDFLIIFDYLNILTPKNILAPQLHSNTNFIIQTVVFAPAMLLTITVIADFVAKLVRERTQLSAKLQVVSSERAETEAIIQGMGSALVAIDSNENITDVNHAFESLTGWKKDEVMGANIDSILPLLDEHGNKVDNSLRPLTLLLNSETTSKIPSVKHISRYYYGKKNQGSFPFVGSIAPITLSGKIIGAVTVFEDASSIKQIDQLKTNFIALASHQLKTPISEIKGYAENMLDGIIGPLSKRQTEYITDIHDITIRCNKLITDLLDASVLEQNQIRLDMETVKLSDIIKKIASIYEARLKQKSIKLNVLEPNLTIEVHANREALIEIVGNVIANSVNYSKPHTNITIETKKEDGYGLILITDEGAGMDKKVLDSLFLKEDVLSSAPEAEGGTGVGLYLAKQLLSLQKGEIKVISSTSNGTTMAIKIPLKGDSHDARIKL